MKLNIHWLFLPAIIVASAIAALDASFFFAPLESAPVRAGAAPPAQSIALRSVPGAPAQGFSVTRIAHASMLLDFGNAKVLIDPWFSEKMHFHHGEPLAMAMEQLPKLTAIVASHAHYDHFDIETLKRYPDTAVPFFVGSDMADAARAAVFAYANNGGLGLHLDGMIDGFNRSVNAAHRQLYTGIGQDPDFMHRASDVARQQRFFDRFLKGVVTGTQDPAVEATVRTAGGAVKRTGNRYPLASTAPRTMYLDAASRRLTSSMPSAASNASYTADYGATTAPVRFETAPLPEDLEIVDPALLRLYVSSSVTDADLFVAVREIRPDGTEVTVQGAQDPALPVSLGWLRVSRRNTDAARTTPYKAWHTFDRKEPMAPGQLYEVEVNVWPIAWRLAKGNRPAIEIGGSEQKGMLTFAHPATGPFASGGGPVRNGVAPAGNVSVHTGSATASFIRLAVNNAG